MSFEAHAAETELVIESPSQKSSVQIGLSWSEGTGKYKLTKIITLAPRFVVKNCTSETLHFREHGVPPAEKSTVSAGGITPLMFIRAQDLKLITFSYEVTNAKW